MDRVEEILDSLVRGDYGWVQNDNTKPISQARKALADYLCEVVEGEKELHNHNSIPGYIDCVDEGCVVCIKNQALDTIKGKIREVVGWKTE
jgi:hypothetical protein